MSDIAKSVGQRIRNYRTQLGWSQEKLAELSGCHPTYIGQLERGENNATLESIEKIASAMNIPLSKLFEKLGGNRQISRRIKKHLWLSNRSWARDVHSFGILHSWGALAGKSCSAQASSIWLIAGAFRRTQSK